MPLAMRATLLLAIAACGGSSGPSPVPPPASSARPAPLVIATPRLTDGDVEVARVNGRPVWSSCVATQAAGAGSAEQLRRDALDQCIAFELLAQARADAKAGKPRNRFYLSVGLALGAMLLLILLRHL